jgi:DNA polymerase-1
LFERTEAKTSGRARKSTGINDLSKVRPGPTRRPLGPAFDDEHWFEDEMPETLFIVDVYSLVFQVFHAIPEMTGPSGQPTNAVFGFTRDLQTIRALPGATYLICALDVAGPAARNELFAEYKANRSEIPVDLTPQIPRILDVMEGFGIPALGYSGWEADDVIATVVRLASERGIQSRIVTSDKDVRQLLSPLVQIFNVRKNTFYDADSLQLDWGVRPDQVVDFQSLVGDAVDNVPGIPLVGPKKASALLQQFETLEEVLKNADKAPGAKLKENLKNFADQARTSRKLVELNTQLPIDVDWDAARIKPPDRTRLRALFTELGFRRFADEMRADTPARVTQQSLLLDPNESSAPATTEAAVLGEADAESEPFVLGEPSGSNGDKARPAAPARTKPAAPPEEVDPSQYRGFTVIDTEAAFESFVRELAQQPTFALDLETTDVDPLVAEVVGWAFSWQEGLGYYLPVRAPAGQTTLGPQHVAEALRPILENPATVIVNQNIKFEMLVLRRFGIELGEIGLDPMVGDYLLDAGGRGHGLDALAEKFLGHHTIPIRDLIGTASKQISRDGVDVPKIAEYAAEDAQVAFSLAQIVEKELKAEKLWDLYWDLERPLIRVLADMQSAGIRVDKEELARQSADVTRRLSALVEDIYEEAGGEFNIDSPLQLRKVLFEQLKLPVLKRTKTGPSTDQDVLERLALQHSLPAKIIEQRQLSKLKGTYLDALPKMVNPNTGRIHCSFNQVVATTGRLSASDPNLQNIPIRTEEGRRVRRAFLASPDGWKLLCADYSQIELRMLAHFSRDRALQEAFRQGADIHSAVAQEVFGVAEAEVTPEMRRIAKAVNFGVIYGQSPFGLAAALGIGADEAAQFIESYFTRYAGVTRYLQTILRESHQSGYAHTILGRRRPISGIRPAAITRTQRNLAERTAINAVIQGSAADLIKRAMLNLSTRLREARFPAKLLLQIHDELVFDVPDQHVRELADMVRREMEHAMELEVPLVVDLSAGDNWLDVETID